MCVFDSRMVCQHSEVVRGSQSLSLVKINQKNRIDHVCVCVCVSVCVSECVCMLVSSKCTCQR